MSVVIDNFIYKRDGDDIIIIRESDKKVLGNINIDGNDIYKLIDDDQFNYAVDLYEKTHKSPISLLADKAVISFELRAIPYIQEKTNLSILQKIDTKLPQVLIGIAVIGFLIFMALTIILGIWVIPAFIFAYRAEKWIADNAKKYDETFSWGRVAKNSLLGPIFIHKYYKTFGTLSLSI